MAEDQNNSCEITGTLGFIVQAILGLLAFAVLIIKRQYERPKRQVKIWVLDTSKQGISQLIAHALNVILALVLSKKGTDDPCNWYFVTITFDTTIGVGICYIILKLVEILFDYFSIERLKTGNYFRIFTPDEQMALDEFKRKSEQYEEKLVLIRPVIKVDYCIWSSQLGIWVLIVVCSKMILYAIQNGLATQLQQLAGWIFQGLSEHPNIKLMIVMVLVPLLLNSLQFWIQDNILKKSEFTKFEQQYLTSEMYVNLEIEDMLKNEDYEAHCTSHHNHTSKQNKHNNILISKTDMPIEYEFEQYNHDSMK